MTFLGFWVENTFSHASKLDQTQNDLPPQMTVGMDQHSNLDDNLKFWLLMRPAWGPHNWSLRMKDARERRRSHNGFYDLSLEGTHCYFCNISLITLCISSHMGGNSTGTYTTECGDHWGYFIGWLPHSTKSNFWGPYSFPIPLLFLKRNNFLIPQNFKVPTR